MLVGWGPMHAATLVALDWAFGARHPLLGPVLIASGVIALGCALHACAWREYGQPTSLTVLVPLSPRWLRLLWAATLLLPVVGAVLYLLLRWTLPEPDGGNSNDDTKYA